MSPPYCFVVWRRQEGGGIGSSRDVITRRKTKKKKRNQSLVCLCYHMAENAQCNHLWRSGGEGKGPLSYSGPSHEATREERKKERILSLSSLLLERSSIHVVVVVTLLLLLWSTSSSWRRNGRHSILNWGGFFGIFLPLGDGWYWMVVATFLSPLRSIAKRQTHCWLGLPLGLHHHLPSLVFLLHSTKFFYKRRIAEKSIRLSPSSSLLLFILPLGPPPPHTPFIV